MDFFFAYLPNIFYSSPFPEGPIVTEERKKENKRIKKGVRETTVGGLIVNKQIKKPGGKNVWWFLFFFRFYRFVYFLKRVYHFYLIGLFNSFLSYWAFQNNYSIILWF